MSFNLFENGEYLVTYILLFVVLFYLFLCTDMKKMLLLCTILFWSLLMVWCGSKKWWSGGQPQVCIKSMCYNVDLATTEKEQQEWLQWVEELADDAGMLFVFENLGVHEFWMKDTLIPLDMIWLDADGKVLFVKEYAAPCNEEDSAKNDCQRYGPPEWTQSKYVLEINANKTRESWIFEWVKLDLYNIE